MSDLIAFQALDMRVDLAFSDTVISATDSEFILGEEALRLEYNIELNYVDGLPAGEIGTLVIRRDGEVWVEVTGLVDYLLSSVLQLDAEAGTYTLAWSAVIQGGGTITGSSESDYLLTAGKSVVMTEGADTLDGSGGTQGWLGFGDADQFVVIDLQTPEANAGAAETITIISPGRLGATAFADTLMGDDAANYFFAGAGDDVVRGFGGEDTILGSVGEDSLFGGDGRDWLWGGDDNDIVSGGRSLDRIFGGLGDDTLYGDEGSDSLVGGDGNDILDGGDDRDTLKGGSGNDLLQGWAATDFLVGGGGRDTLIGGDGRDNLQGEAGNDLLFGGSDSDFMYGGDGSDTMIGGDDFDYGYGGAGDDFIFGGGAGDSLFGEAGNDVLGGGEGWDRLVGGWGNDTLWGGADRDNLSGGAGNDVLWGGDWTDILDGGAGDDTLNGGRGNDVIYAGEGNDTMSGNAGADYFVFDLSLDLGSDVITDFDVTAETLAFWDSEDLAENFAVEDIQITESGALIVFEDVLEMQVLGVFDAEALFDQFSVLA